MYFNDLKDSLNLELFFNTSFLNLQLEDLIFWMNAADLATLYDINVLN